MFDLSWADFCVSSVAVAILVESLAIAHGCVRASRVLHDAMLRRCLRAPMSFFDTTPNGRIMNRFSKDFDLIDTKLPNQLRQWLFAVAPLMATFVVISYSTPVFVFVMIPVTTIYVIVQVRLIYHARTHARMHARTHTYSVPNNNKNTSNHYFTNM